MHPTKFRASSTASRRSIAVLPVLASLLALPALPQEFKPDIPKAWDDKEVERFELPLAQRDRSPRYMTSEEYYKLKVRPIYRTYPAYPPGREPAGYIESLKAKEPEVIFDPSKLHTKQDWIEAGKVVFEADIEFHPASVLLTRAGRYLPVLSKDGTFPGFTGLRYVIRKKGVLEIGALSCANCHTRVMPDGSLLEGAQGTLLRNPEIGKQIRNEPSEDFRKFQEVLWADFGAPWIQGKEAFLAAMTRETVAHALEAQTSGVIQREGTSLAHPPHVPSLIGIQDLKHLDATGLVNHRSIGDLMRYAIVNQGLDTLAHFGDFLPGPEGTNFSGELGVRYSDEQLYALALYVSSLKPPPNPNPVDDRARRGEKVFQREGCPACHTPPLYTNNKLTPALGFKVPADLLKTGEVLNVSVGTDPTLALKTRRGTGFYKVPSLRGVWYRNSFSHTGQAETLEEWFDPARLKSDYVPRGFHLSPGPIQGHEFGLKLSSEDREDLIAFLKTL
ncbi:MAG: hypothetical protein JST11_25190 [Acidobacteria bacterium]|nr:hypothetical protein [Acidobacteriota bacterium]